MTWQARMIFLPFLPLRYRGVFPPRPWPAARPAYRALVFPWGIPWRYKADGTRKTGKAGNPRQAPLTPPPKSPKAPPLKQPP